MGDELATGTESESVVTGAIFRLLADSRRRKLLACLKRHDEPLPVADVAEEIAVHNRDGDIRDVSAEEVERIHLSLYHTHIPKLEDHDIAVYDQARDTVTLTANANALAPYVEPTSENAPE